jgi:hypothetical protein
VGGRASDADILAALRPFVRAGRIGCPRALEVAARLGAGPARVGRICDREGIKITRCQLGCFGRPRRRLAPPVAPP